MASRATSVVVKAQLLADMRRAESAQRFLSEASKQFAQSLDYEATLKNITHLAVPAIADWCVVDLLQDGKLRRVSVAHTDPDKAKVARELERRYPPDLTTRAGVPNVIRTGTPEFHPEVSDDELAAAARDPEHLRLLRELGIRAYIIVPILFARPCAGHHWTRHGRIEPTLFRGRFGACSGPGPPSGDRNQNARLYAEAEKSRGIA